MPKRLSLLLGGVLGVFCAGLAWTLPRLSTPDAPVAVITDANIKDFTLKEQEAAGLCPWRNRDADLKRFFPMATSTEEVTLILSAHRNEVSRQLGRMPTGDENTLRAYRALHNGNYLGMIVPRRIRGESGVIELVLAVGADGKVIGVSIQRLREPDNVARALHSSAWLNQFQDKTAASDWSALSRSPVLPAEVQPSAAAIVEGARVAMILLTIAQAHR